MIQTIGRAARNVDGRVILYADRMTGSMERAIAETDRRRERQMAYNAEHGITPETVKRDIKEIMDSPYESREMDRLTKPGVAEASKPFVGSNFQAALRDLEGRMREAASNLEFEEAARLRDEVKRLKAVELAVIDDPTARQSKIKDATASWPQPKAGDRRASSTFSGTE